MTRLNTVIDKLLILHRGNCKTLARLKALEAIMIESVPTAERASWYQRLDQQTNRCLQELLEEFEKQSPGFAALLDDRGPDELTGLE